MFFLRCFWFTGSLVLGAMLSRWHGGGFFPAPKWLKNLMFALPLGAGLVALSYFSLLTLGFGSIADVVAATIATGCILAFKAMGHGGGFDLGHSNEEPGAGRDLEKIERWFGLYPKLFGLLPRYSYDLLMLVIKGGLMAAAPAALFAAKSFISATIMLLGGLVGFPLAYMIGWSLFDYAPFVLVRLGLEPTELAELLSGAFFFGAFVLAVFVVI